MGVDHGEGIGGTSPQNLE